MAKILGGMAAVHTVQVVVEIDPSHPVFAKFRVSHGFYTEFCGKLLKDVLKAMPKLEVVQITCRPSVLVDGPLISRLREEVEAQGRKLTWGENGLGIFLDDITGEVALPMKRVSSKEPRYAIGSANTLCLRDLEVSDIPA